MNKQHDLNGVLFDIIEDKNFESFENNLMVFSAVQHQMIIIGEATKRLSDDFRKKHPSVPWKDMAGMRDVLIHQYHNANPKRIWDTATINIPDILEIIEAFLP